MIVGKTFVWLHFPKTGGHTVAAAIQAAGRGRRDLVFDDEREVGEGWHDTLAHRMRRDAGFDPTGKTVISGVRRLPWWLLSWVHYEASRPPFHCASREMLCRGEFYENNGRLNHADAHMTQFSAHPVEPLAAPGEHGRGLRRPFRDPAGAPGSAPPPASCARR